MLPDQVRAGLGKTPVVELKLKSITAILIWMRFPSGGRQGQSLGVVQSILGPSFLNPRLGGELRPLSNLDRVARITGASACRPTSVSVSVDRYPIFIAVAWPLVPGFCGYLLLRQNRGSTLAFVSIDAAPRQRSILGLANAVWMLVFQLSRVVRQPTTQYVSP